MHRRWHIHAHTHTHTHYTGIKHTTLTHMHRQNVQMHLCQALSHETETEKNNWAMAEIVTRVQVCLETQMKQNIQLPKKKKKEKMDLRKKQTKPPPLTPTPHTHTCKLKKKTPPPQKKKKKKKRKKRKKQERKKKCSAQGKKPRDINTWNAHPHFV